jgi:glycosyltransferase involved in cell wall biosynthesis
VDFDHFNAVTKPNKVPVNPEVSSLKHPVIGFVGAIYDWIDIDLICELADTHPEYSILLVGPVSFGKENFEARQNVTMVGTKPYQSLPTYLANIDVCLIPFKLNDITLASNPIKMYEYLASGKPVVSTALPEIIRNGIGVVYIGKNHEDFIKKVERAVTETKDETAAFERVDFARKNSWDSRVDVMLQLFKDATETNKA